MSQPSIQDVDAAVRSILLGRGPAASVAATGRGEVFAERLLSLRHAESLAQLCNLLFSFDPIDPAFAVLNRHPPIVIHDDEV